MTDFDYEDYLSEEKKVEEQSHISFWFYRTPKQKTQNFWYKNQTSLPVSFYTINNQSMKVLLLILFNNTQPLKYFKIKLKAKDDIEIPSGEGKENLSNLQILIPKQFNKNQNNYRSFL